MSKKMENHRIFFGMALFFSIFILTVFSLVNGCTRNVTVAPTLPLSPAVIATKTPTPTFTPAFTFTPTNTFSPVNSPTPTLTPTITPTFTDTPTITSTPTPTNTPTATNTPTVTSTPYPAGSVLYQNFNSQPWTAWESADSGLSVDPASCGTYYSVWVPAWGNGTTIASGGYFLGQGGHIASNSPKPKDLAMTMVFDGTTFQIKDNFVSSCPYTIAGSPPSPPTVETAIQGCWNSFGGTYCVLIGSTATYDCSTGTGCVGTNPNNISFIAYAQAPATFGMALNSRNPTCTNISYYIGPNFTVPADGLWHNVIVPLTAGSWDVNFANVNWSSICGVDIFFTGPTSGLPVTNVVSVDEIYFTP